MTDLKDIFNEWQNNIKFRDAFRKNPEKALLDAGFEVNPEDLEKIRAIFKLDKSKDDILDDRKSK